MSLSLCEKNWFEREKISKIKTIEVMKKLVKRKLISSFTECEKEVDKQGTDFIVEDKRVQFKFREKKGFNDISINFLQPFYGIDGPIVENPRLGKTCYGRDYLSIRDKKHDEYYVGSRNSEGVLSVSIISTKKLTDLMQSLYSFWGNHATEPMSSWTPEKLKKEAARFRTFIIENDVGQIWLHKNYQEDFHKINFYIFKKFIDKELILD